MSQARTKVIDVTRGFLVCDPNSFLNNQGFTQQEDAPEQEPPILPYEGYNFLPTSYGFKSYFGANSLLDIAALTSRCDRVLLYQFAALQNILVALCEDGIWVSRPNVSGNTWVHSVTLTVPAVGSYLEFTYAVIENKLYIYRQGDASYYRLDSTAFDIGTGAITWVTVTPTFLNMAGQMGIFRANGRLGFWDSANSVSWSSSVDLSDFTPALTTLAGNAVFLGVLGRIVTIKPQGDGFVIYSTKSIVGAKYNAAGGSLWDSTPITDNAGIWYDREVTHGITDLEHYAYTNAGIKKIGAYNALNKTHAFEDIIPDVYDLLKEARQPVYLDMINGRYLFFSLISADYIDGKVSFVYNTIDQILARVLVSGATWDGITILPTLIQGQLLGTWIADQYLLTLQRQGVFHWFTGYGESFFPGVGITNNDTPLHPYNTDTWGIHVPNTSNLITTTIGAAPFTDALAVVNGFFPSEVDAMASKAASLKHLGLTHTIGNPTLASINNIDSFFTDFLLAQYEEWNNLFLIQAANIAELSVPPHVYDTVLGALPGSPSVTAATIARDAKMVDYAAGIAGAVIDYGAGTVTSSVLLGSMLDGINVSHVIVNTLGTETRAVTYSDTATFTGGYDINATTVRTFPIVKGDATRATKTVNVYNLNSYSPTYPNYNPAYVPPIGADAPSIFGQSSEFSLTPVMNTLLGLCPDPWVSPLAPAFAYVSPSIVGQDIVYASYYFYQGAGGYPNGPVTGPFAGAPLNGATIASTDYPYFVDYFDTLYIDIVPNPTITGTSTVSFRWTDMEWAIFTEGEPTGAWTEISGSITVPGTGLVGNTNLPLDLNVIYPGATYLLQDGTSAPIYPTFTGALVYDTSLKKWGKVKHSYRTLIDYSPINTLGAGLTYTNFGVDMAALDPAGAIHTFDSRPTDSWIRWGRLGMSRIGMTKIHYVSAHFRSSSTGDIIVDTSIDGRALEPSLTKTYPFSLAASVIAPIDSTGKLHTIKVSGQFDLQYLEVNGNVAGRR